MICCDDFGHGENHAILPIGRRAVLDGLLERARERRGESGQIAVEIVVVCCILQWKYQAQVYLGPARGA